MCCSRAKQASKQSDNEAVEPRGRLSASAETTSNRWLLSWSFYFLRAEVGEPGDERIETDPDIPSSVSESKFLAPRQRGSAEGSRDPATKFFGETRAEQQPAID